MSDVLQPAPPAPELAAQSAAVSALSQFKGGANLLFWIAGFSLLNMVTVLMQLNFVMLLGLGVTIFATALGDGVGSIGIVAAALFVFGISGLFAAFGWFARRGHVWAFTAGLVLYVLDALLVLWAGDWLMLAFHALFTFQIARGLLGLRRLRAAGYEFVTLDALFAG